MIHKPHVDWFALSPSLSMLGAAGLLLLVAVFAPKAIRKPVSAVVCGTGFVTAFVFGVLLADKARTGRRSSPTRSSATGGRPPRRS